MPLTHQTEIIRSEVALKFKSNSRRETERERGRFGERKRKRERGEDKLELSADLPRKKISDANSN